MKGPVRAGPNRRRETSDFGGRLPPFTGMSHLGVPRQIALTIASFPQIVFGNLKFSLMEVPANGDASASSGNIPAFPTYQRLLRTRCTTVRHTTFSMACSCITNVTMAVELNDLPSATRRVPSSLRPQLPVAK
jgi:hypothetical protein